MDLLLLGPVEARLDGRSVPLGATKQRAVLAMLALRANRTVSIDRLVDGLWGDDPPPTAAKMVQLYVSQLRRLLADSDARIETHGRDYELRVADDAVDVARLERLVDQAADGGAQDAARAALALWRGAPLADVSGEPFAAPEIRRLEELWLEASELAIDADLAAGRNQAALGELERLIDEHPLRERFHAQRMLALYRSGRQADALEAYTAARRRLVDDVGLEPGAELRELHERILRQDPALRPPASAHEPPAGPRQPRTPAAHPAPRRLLLGAAAAALLALAVFAATRLLGPHHLPGIDANAVGVIDPKSAAITDQYPNLISEPGAVVGGGGSVWVASPSAGTVSRIRGDRVVTFGVGAAPESLAFGAGSLWVADEQDGIVRRVDPMDDHVVQPIRAGNGLQAVTVGEGAVWAATALDGEVVRIDPASGRETRIPVGGHPVALSTGLGAVWVAQEDADAVVRIDPRSGETVDSIPVGAGPSALAAGLGAVWTANQQDGTVSRIDPRTDRATTVAAGRSPVALTIARGSVWVADADGAILRLDPRRQAVLATVRTGSSPSGLATIRGAVWATTTAPSSAHRGGTLRVGVGSVPLYLDPAIGGHFDPASLLALAYEGLLDFRRAPGVAGTRLVGGLARAVPAPADDGLRYVFRLRPGLRYSDGTRVRPSDFRIAIERVLVDRRLGDTRPALNAVEGIAACHQEPGHCDLSSGIVGDDRAGTVTFRLRRRDPDLLATLALPLFALVSPRAERPRLSRAPVGAGPYVVAQLSPRRALLTRNPYFRAGASEGRPPGMADRIVLERGRVSAQVAATARGQLDVTRDVAPGQIAALRGNPSVRVQTGPWAATRYAWLNVRTPPFNDVRVRQALNLAIDRAHLVDLRGGPETATATCQLLPPGLPGYRPVCPFTASPSRSGAWKAADLAQAKQLVAASRTRGTSITVWAWEPTRYGRYLSQVLRRLGFRSHVRVVGLNTTLPDDVRRLPQIGVGGWVADSPEPGRFLYALVGCGGDGNVEKFCDRRIDAMIARARAAGPSAGAAWQRIESRIASAAPAVPLINDRAIAVTSRRVGNVQFSPLTGLLLDKVWVH
jgi:ABC-type transport system substrate-binding protein/DNA-binding SARP family transcriptional activator/streptogramin lyase